MKRTMIVMLALAMFLAWGTSAMAQQNPGNICAFVDGDPIKAVTYPYLTSSEGWWGGFAVINTGAAIPARQLCFVANTQAGRQLIVKGTDIPGFGGIAARGMYVNLIENLDTVDPRWNERLILGVYTNNQGIADNLSGFGMVGNTTSGEAQGYNALSQFPLPSTHPAINQNGDDQLWFRYVPGQDGTTWWRGLAVVNNRNATSGGITIEARYNDGTSDIYNWTNPATIGPHQMRVGLLEQLIPNIRTQQSAQIFVRGTAGQDVLLGFVMYGNTNTGEAQGMLGDIFPQ